MLEITKGWVPLFYNETGIATHPERNANHDPWIMPPANVIVPKLVKSE
jgi:hypothetical protein